MGTIGLLGGSHHVGHFHCEALRHLAALGGRPAAILCSALPFAPTAPTERGRPSSRPSGPPSHISFPHSPPPPPSTRPSLSHPHLAHPQLPISFVWLRCLGGG